MKLRRGTMVTWMAVIAGVGVTLALVLRGGRSTGVQPLGPAAAAVRVATVTEGRVERRLTLHGRLMAAESADLAPRLTAPVMQRLVGPGDRVRRGQTLMVLDDIRLQAEVRAGEAELAAALSQAEAAAGALAAQQAATRRDHILLAAGAVSEEHVETSEVRLVQARAGEVAAASRIAVAKEALLGARERLRDTRVEAPWDGAVAAVLVEPGDLAIAGRPVLRLVGSGRARVRVQLPQGLSGAVHPGAAVVLTHGGEELSAVVSRVAAGLDRSGLTSVEADLDRLPFGLTDGAAVGVAVTVESAEGLVVPAGALLRGEAGDFVFRVEAGVAQPVAVRVGATSGDLAVVDGSLREGDLVVVEHPSVLMRLADGVAVRVVGGGAP